MHTHADQLKSTESRNISHIYFQFIFDKTERYQKEKDGLFNTVLEQLDIHMEKMNIDPGLKLYVSICTYIIIYTTYINLKCVVYLNV